MNKYELVMIVDAASPQEEKETIVKDAIESVGKCEGKLVNRHVWLEKHKFSFPIKKRREGTYYILNIEAPPTSITKIRQLLKLQESILRTLFVRVS